MADYEKYFVENRETMYKLEELHKKKVELKRIIQELNVNESYIMELSGLPRTGKSVTMDRLYEFFKFGKIDIQRTKEPAQIIKEKFSEEELSKVSGVEFNDMTLQISRGELKRNINLNPDIIIQDRGVIDNYFWYQMMYNDGKINRETFIDKLKDLKEDINQVDKIFVLVAKPEVAVARDYSTQIYLEPRKKTTEEGIAKLKKGLDDLAPVLIENGAAEKLVFIDTTSIKEIETSIIVADKLMDGMKQKLLKKYSQ